MSSASLTGVEPASSGFGDRRSTVKLQTQLLHISQLFQFLE